MQTVRKQMVTSIFFRFLINIAHSKTTRTFRVFSVQAREIYIFFSSLAPAVPTDLQLDLVQWDLMGTEQTFRVQTQILKLKWCLSLYKISS